MEGRSLNDLFKGREDQLNSFQERMKSVAAEQGLPFGERTMTYNSRLSQELGSWADTQPNGEVLHDALYRAYFVDNRDISDVDVLIQLADTSHLDADLARKVLAERTFREKVDDDWNRARSIGLSGVPTFVSSDLYVVGCQSYDVLLRFLNHLRKLKGAEAT